MAQVIILTQEDGTCAVVHLAPGSTFSIEDMRVRAAERNNATDAEIVEDSVIPSDWTFRNAWVKVASVIDTDMVRAREIWRGVIREARDPKLAALDVEFQRCVEENVDTTEVVQQKQELRDAPQDPAIDAAQTPEELKAVWPAVLEEPLARSPASKNKGA